MSRQQLIARLNSLIRECNPNGAETAVLLSLSAALQTGREVELMHLVVTEFVEPELAEAEQVVKARLN